MEYIQTILFQVPATRLEEAMATGGLLSELDPHREYLRNQPGFRDLRITRSINNEGNILMLVETRWTDDGSLVRYETNEPNAASIVRKHEHVLVPGSLQVLDMEALRTESSFKPQEQAQHARERTVLPIVIPIGILAFLLLVIYGMSRVYLEIRGDNATGLAAGIAIFVLIVAFFLANNPKASGVQIGGILVICALILVGGTIWAVVQEDDHGEAVAHEPTPAPGESPGAGGTEIDLQDNKIVYGGQENPAIPAIVGENTFTVKNTGIAIHNIHVDGTDDTYPVAFCSPTDGQSTACTDPARVPGGGEGTLVFTPTAPGTYNFRCDYHTTEMVGTFVVP
jgi:plastocyanin/heme-degrading monooxygenase HmoA